MNKKRFGHNKLCALLPNFKILKITICLVNKYVAFRLLKFIKDNNALIAIPAVAKKIIKSFK